MTIITLDNRRVDYVFFLLYFTPRYCYTEVYIENNYVYFPMHLFADKICN